MSNKKSLKEDIKFSLLIFFVFTTTLLSITTYTFVSIANDLTGVINDYKNTYGEINNG